MKQYWNNCYPFVHQFSHVNKMSLLSLQNSFVSLADCDNPRGLSSVINPLQPELRQTAGQIYLHVVVVWAPAPQHMKTLSLQGRALPFYSCAAETCGVF